MTQGQILDFFKEMPISKRTLHATEIINISKFITPQLKIDKDTYELYLLINVDKLSETNIPIEEMYVLKEQGWALDKQSCNLILFQ